MSEKPFGKNRKRKRGEGNVETEYNQKWGPRENPIEAEMKMMLIQPPDALLMQKELVWLTDKMEDESLEDSLRNGIGRITAKRMNKMWKQGEIDGFAVDFQAWLNGTSPHNVSTWRTGPLKGRRQTPWGTRSLAKMEDVRKYLASFIEKRMEFQRILAILYFSWPKNLVEAYLFYKYLVRGTLIPTGSTSFLADYALYTDTEPTQPMPTRLELAEQAHRSHSFRAAIADGDLPALRHWAQRVMFDPSTHVSAAERVEILNAYNDKITANGGGANGMYNLDDIQALYAQNEFALEMEGLVNPAAYLSAYAKSMLGYGVIKDDKAKAIHKQVEKMDHGINPRTIEREQKELSDALTKTFKTKVGPHRLTRDEFHASLPADPRDIESFGGMMAHARMKGYGKKEGFTRSMDTHADRLAILKSPEFKQAVGTDTATHFTNKLHREYVELRDAVQRTKTAEGERGRIDEQSRQTMAYLAATHAPKDILEMADILGIGKATKRINNYDELRGYLLNAHPGVINNQQHIAAIEGNKAARSYLVPITRQASLTHRNEQEQLVAAGMNPIIAIDFGNELADTYSYLSTTAQQIREGRGNLDSLTEAFQLRMGQAREFFERAGERMQPKHSRYLVDIARAAAHGLDWDPMPRHMADFHGGTITHEDEEMGEDEEEEEEEVPEEEVAHRDNREDDDDDDQQGMDEGAGGGGNPPGGGGGGGGNPAPPRTPPRDEAYENAVIRNEALTKKSQQFKAQLEQTETLVTQKSAEISRLSEERAALYDEIRRLQGAEQLGNFTMAQRNTDIQQLNDKIDALNVQIDTRQQALEAEVAQKTRLSNELVESKRRKRELNEANEKQRESLRGFQESEKRLLEQLEQARKALQQAVVNGGSDIAGLQQQVDILNTQLHQSQQGHKTASEKLRQSEASNQQLQAYTADYNRLKDDLARANQQLEQLRAMNQGGTDKAQRLQEVIDGFNRDLQGKSSRIAQLEKQIEGNKKTFQSQLDDALAGAQASFIDAQAKYSLEKLRLNDEGERLRRDILRLEGTAGNQEEKYRILHDASTKLRNEYLKATSDYEGAIGVLQRQKDDADNQKVTLQQQLEAMKKTGKENLDEKLRLEQLLNKESARAVAAETEIQQHATRIQQYETKIQQYAAYTQQQQTAAQAEAGKAEDFGRELASEKQKLADLQQTHQKSTTEAANLKSEYDKSMTANATFVEAEKQMIARYDVASKSSIEFSTQLNELRRAEVKYQEEIAAQKKEIGQQRGALNANSLALEEQRGQLESLTQQITQLQNENATGRQTLAQKETRELEMNEYAKKTQEYVTETEKKLAANKKAYEGLLQQNKGELNSLSTRITNLTNEKQVAEDYAKQLEQTNLELGVTVGKHVSTQQAAVSAATNMNELAFAASEYMTTLEKHPLNVYARDTMLPSIADIDVHEPESMQALTNWLQQEPSATDMPALMQALNDVKLQLADIGVAQFNTAGNASTTQALQTSFYRSIKHNIKMVARSLALKMQESPTANNPVESSILEAFYSMESLQNPLVAKQARIGLQEQYKRLEYGIANEQSAEAKKVLTELKTAIETVLKSQRAYPATAESVARYKIQNRTRDMRALVAAREFEKETIKTEQNRRKRRRIQIQEVDEQPMQTQELGITGQA